MRFGNIATSDLLAVEKLKQHRSEWCGRYSADVAAMTVARPLLIRSPHNALSTLAAFQHPNIARAKVHRPKLEKSVGPVPTY